MNARVHMAGTIMRYAGTSARCWKYPKRVKDPEETTLWWDQVTCKRCLALKPNPASTRATVK